MTPAAVHPVGGAEGIKQAVAHGSGWLGDWID